MISLSVRKGGQLLLQGGVTFEILRYMLMKWNIKNNSLYNSIQNSAFEQKTDLIKTFKSKKKHQTNKKKNCWQWYFPNYSFCRGILQL